MHRDHADASDLLVTLRTSVSTVRQFPQDSGRKRNTHILVSSTLTLLSWSPTSLLATSSDLALATSRTTLVSNVGCRTASTKNSFSAPAGTSGGRSLIVCCASRRGPWRERNSRAGLRRAEEDEPDGGRRKMRRSNRKMETIVGSSRYTRLQYLDKDDENNDTREARHSNRTLQPRYSSAGGRRRSRALLRVCPVGPTVSPSLQRDLQQGQRTHLSNTQTETYHRLVSAQIIYPRGTVSTSG